MNLLTSAIGWLFGGKAGGGGAGNIISVLDGVISTKQKRLELDAEDMKSVRSMLGAAGPGFLNQLIDAVNRSVRPVVTYALIGGLMGWWKLPSIDAVTPFYQTLIYLVFTFWFGGRAIMKDVPTMLAALRKLKKKKRRKPLALEDEESDW